MSRKIIISEEDKEKFKELIFDGRSITCSANIVGINRQAAYYLAKKLGWALACRDIRKHTIRSRNRKIRIDHEEIVKLFDSGKKLREIGDIAGCTRERIRQIVQMCGKNRTQVFNEKKKNKQKLSPLIRVLKQILIKKKREIARNNKIDELKEKWADIIKMWDDGLMVKDIVEKTGLDENYISWHIGILRQRYGFFPKRKIHKHYEDLSIQNHDFMIYSGKSPEQIVKILQGIFSKHMGNMINNSKMYNKRRKLKEALHKIYVHLADINLVPKMSEYNITTLIATDRPLSTYS